MATLALGLVGAGIGSTIGGTFLGMSAASIGWSIGSTLGSILFAPDGPNTQGPRLSDLSVQTSTRGAPIPKVYGTARIAGNVIWSGGIQETSHTQDVGGKGGPSSSHTTYTYSCSFAVGLCEGPIVGIRRIWADSVLIYNKGDAATADELAVSNQNGITVYTGSETQLPDPTIEAVEGVGNVPAHRGMAYVVFDTFQLENHGNRIPNFTFEVVEAGTGTYLGAATTVGMSRPSGQTLVAYRVDAANDTVYWKGSNWQGAIYDGNPYEYRVAYDLAGTTIKEADTSIMYTADAFPQASPSWHARFLFPHPVTNIEISSGSFYDSLATNKHKLVFGIDRVLANRALQHPNGTDIVVDSLYPLKGETDGDYLYVRQSDLAEQNHTSVLYKFSIPYSSTYDKIAVAELDLIDDIHDISVDGEFVYTITHPSDGSSGFTISKLTKSLSFVTSWYTSAYHPRCQMVVNGSVAAVTSRTAPYYAVYDLSGVTPVVLENGSTGAPTYSFSGGKTNSMLLNTHAWIGTTPSTISPETTPLSRVLSEICASAGVIEVDVVSIADTVKGYVRTNPMTARAAIEPLLSAYQIGAVESDYKLKFAPLTGVPAETIIDDDLAADINITRALETELPRRVTLAYADKDADYLPAIQSAQRIKSAGQIVNEISQQFSLSTDGDHMSQLSEKILYRAWTERESFDWALTPKHAYLDAGDVVTLENGGFNHITRITSNDQQLPGLINCGGVATRASVYSSNLTGAASNYTQQTLVLVGNTLFEIMDLPALRDADATTAGYYVAVYGQKSNWSSGIVYKSIDSGASWSGLITASTEATMGITTDALPDADAKTWDMTNTVNISMHNGTLASDTVENVLNGANAALIGNELIHYTTATLEGDGTYTLSGLLRGRIGTEHETGTHAIGDRFVLLNATSIYRVSSEYSQKGVANKYKAVTNGQYLESVTDTTDVTFDNLNSKPLSVCQISGSRDGSNNLTINWIRRSRLSGVSLDDPALGEQSELYEVHIMDGAVVKRVIQSATNSADYTASQQTLDGFTPGDPITVNIYQVSATVGRGYVRSETV